SFGAHKPNPRTSIASPRRVELHPDHGAAPRDSGAEGRHEHRVAVADLPGPHALEVFPTRSMFESILPSGTSRRTATWSRIRLFAWWAHTQSTSPGESSAS